MPNVFKSKEVYKHVIKQDNVHQLIPVRGVYVANVYRPPYCIDTTIKLVGISHRAADVDPYTMASYDFYQPEVYPDFTINNTPPVVTYYTTASYTTYNTELIDTSFVVNNNPVDILYYTTNHHDVYDNIIECSFGITNDTVIITPISSYDKINLDTTIRLTGIAATSATITI